MAAQRPSTEVDVCNLALDRCKEDEIATLDDDLNRARACKRQFGKVRDALLRRVDWNFASTWCRPAAEAAEPDGKFQYRYALPADCLAVREVEDLEEDEWEVMTARATVGGVEVETMVLETDSAAPHVRYTRLVDTVRLWDALFIEAFECLLAAAIAPKVGKSTSQQRAYRNEAEELLAPLAMRVDSREKAKSKVSHGRHNAWLNARLGIRRVP